MLNSKLAKRTNKVSTNALANRVFVNDMATLFIFSEIKFNNYNLKH